MSIIEIVINYVLSLRKLIFWTIKCTFHLVTMELKHDINTSILS